MLGGLPKKENARLMVDDELLRVENLIKHFPLKKGFSFQQKHESVRAVDGVSFFVRKGETFGLVGESGCGKSTLGLTILQLYRPTSGQVYLNGVELTEKKGKDLRSIRKRMQIIFQDPYASLNPRMTIGECVAEPLVIYKIAKGEELKERVKNLLSNVGLNPSYSNRYPHEFSGGQRQRCGIARALALDPDLVVCDEPISALDVSIQSQVINLLRDLQDEHGMAYLFISHDLSVVRYICDRVAVMYLGVIVELANRDDLYDNPLHPYTKALLAANPIADPVLEKQRESIILQGDVPSPINPPSGCRFRTRCPIATDICSEQVPEWREVLSNHWVACHHVN
jgi:oligopeptide transport system ATP-binding protein